MKIDAHQHFWRFDPVRDAWITEEMKVIQRDFLPEHLQPLLTAHQMDGCVAVQADQSEVETDFLLALAAQHPFVKGVVGWTDLRADNLPKRLERWADNNRLKGFRHIVQAEPPGFLQDRSFLQGVTFILQQGYAYDLLVYAHQLPEAIDFVKQLPEAPVVIDHLAKPNIRKQEFNAWHQSMQVFKNMPQVHCKLSGLITEGDWTKWSPTDFTPYLDAALEIFGAKRLLFGTDWPVCLLAGTYTQVVALVDTWMTALSDDEKNAIMGANAIRFYNLEV